MVFSKQQITRSRTAPDQVRRRGPRRAVGRARVGRQQGGAGEAGAEVLSGARAAPVHRVVLQVEAGRVVGLASGPGTGVGRQTEEFFVIGGRLFFPLVF